MKQAVHFGFEKKIVDGIEVDVQRRGRASHETRPLPSIILGVQQEVSADDGDARRHHKENADHQQHEAEYVIDFVGPERGEDEVHFNEDGAER